MALFASVAGIGCWRDVTGAENVERATVRLRLPLGSDAIGSALVLPIGGIRVSLTRLSGATALDTAVSVAEGDDIVELSLTVPLTVVGAAAVPSEVLVVAVAFATPLGDTVFRAGPDTIQFFGTETATAVEVALRYVGVGADAAAVEAVASLSVVAPGDTLTVSASALDALGEPIAGTPLRVRSPDQSLLAEAAAAPGMFVASDARGSARIEATSLTGLADTVSVLLPGPPAISLEPDEVILLDTLGSVALTQMAVAVSNVGVGSIEGLAVAGIDWLAGPPGWLSATLSGSSAPTTLTLTANATGLPVGVYRAVARVNSVSATDEAAVAVRFIVRAPNRPTLNASWLHTCAITMAGPTRCWGQNINGQLGDGTLVNRDLPVQVDGAGTFVSLATGLVQTCGVTVAMSAYCWGGNTFGETGSGSPGAAQTSPVAVTGSISFLQISSAWQHACGLAASGAVYCWGVGSAGQLGYGGRANQSSPTLVAGGISFTALAVGQSHACGISVERRTYCWGNNSSGNLGDGTTTERLVPTEVDGGHQFEKIYSSYHHTCALTSDGTAFCWGSGMNYQIGDGVLAVRTVPTQVSTALRFTTMSTGYTQTCGITATGEAFCWGDAIPGDGTDGSTDARRFPSRVVGDHVWTRITSGQYFNCAMTRDGDVYCWGANNQGQLGDGTQMTRLTPTLIPFGPYVP